MTAYFSDLLKTQDHTPTPAKPAKDNETLAPLAALAEVAYPLYTETLAPLAALAGSHPQTRNSVTPASLSSRANVPDDEMNATGEQPAPSPKAALCSETVERDKPDERAALVESGANVPRRWAEGYAALCSMAPAPGFSLERWRRIVDAAGIFIDRWAVKAIECGWSDLDVFGCDRDRPDARFDCMGLVLLLDRMEVVSLDPAGADLRSRGGNGATQRFRHRPLPRHVVPLWELADRHGL